ncbi:MAG TPA: hypothetical protein EYO23_07700 [Alphaproteobacteria bacterium]|nr:hypothetical protein [Alphaproteobacteria bacterium]
MDVYFEQKCKPKSIIKPSDGDGYFKCSKDGSFITHRKQFNKNTEDIENGFPRLRARIKLGGFYASVPMFLFSGHLRRLEQLHTLSNR